MYFFYFYGILMILAPRGAKIMKMTISKVDTIGAKMSGFCRFLKDALQKTEHSKETLPQFDSKRKKYNLGNMKKF